MTIVFQLKSLHPMARRLVAMKFFSYVGLMGSYFIGIMGTLAYTAGGDEWWTSWCVGMINLAEMVGNMVSGHIVDRVGPRRHFVIAAASIVIASLAFLPLSTSVGRIMIGATLVGLAWGLGGPIMQAYPAYLSDDLDELKTINAALNTAVSSAVVVGPLVGGAISLMAPSQYVLLFAAAGALISLIPGLGFTPLRDPNAERAATQDADNQEQGCASALEGFRVVAGSSTLRLLLVSGFMAFFAYGAFDPLETLYYRDVLKAGVEWMGVLSSAAGAGALVGGLALLHLPKRHVNMRTFLVMLMAEGLGCVLYTATGNIAIALAGQIIVGVANGAFQPLQTTLIQVHAPLDSVGRVTAAIGLGYTCSGVAPLLVAPVLANMCGVQAVLVGSGLCVAVFPLIVQLIFKDKIAASVAEERALAEKTGE